MKYHPINAKSLSAEKSRVQTGCRVRLIDDLDDIAAAVRIAESRLANHLYKKDWQGTTAVVDLHAFHKPSSYSGVPYTTVVELIRRATVWQFRLARRISSPRTLNIQLPAGVENALLTFAER